MIISRKLDNAVNVITEFRITVFIVSARASDLCNAVDADNAAFLRKRFYLLIGEVAVTEVNAARI